MQRGELLHPLGKIGDRRRLFGEFDALEHRERGLQRRQVGGPGVLELLAHCERLFRAEIARGRGAVDPQIVQGREHVCGRFGHGRDPVHRSDPPPRIPGAECQHDDDDRHQRCNDRLENEIDRKTIEHCAFPRTRFPRNIMCFG